MADGQEQHEVISLLKDLAISLGRSPRLEDLVGCKELSVWRLKKAFGSFSVAMKAAGLDLAKESKKRKVTNEIFERDLSLHLQEQHERQVEPKFSNFILPKDPYPTTVFLGDFHAPFNHVGATQFAIDVIAELKPKRVVQGGDLRDMFSASKYPRSHNLFTPKEEIEMGTKICQKLWADIQ